MAKELVPVEGSSETGAWSTEGVRMGEDKSGAWAGADTTKEEGSGKEAGREDTGMGVEAVSKGKGIGVEAGNNGRGAGAKAGIDGVTVEASREGMGAGALICTLGMEQDTGVGTEATNVETTAGSNAAEGSKGPGASPGGGHGAEATDVGALTCTVSTGGEGLGSREGKGQDVESRGEGECVTELVVNITDARAAAALTDADWLVPHVVGRTEDTCVAGGAESKGTLADVTLSNGMGTLPDAAANKGRALGAGSMGTGADAMGGNLREVLSTRG